MASLSFTSLFFSEFSSLGILGCALGVPGVHLSSGVCTVSSVFFHQILLYCLLLLGASLHLCLALPHPWLSVETLVVVCHRRNIKRFFLQIHHSKFPPHCFAVSTLCNWCLIFRIFLCASMFVHASMRLNQKMRHYAANKSPRRKTLQKGCPFLKALQNDAINPCPLSNQDAPNDPT